MRRRNLLIGLAGIALLGLGGWLAYQRFTTPVVPNFASDEDHFKYGSIGNDGATGIPYAIWAALPQLCPDHLPGPGGYRSLGFIYEPDGPEGVPIGFSRARVGVDRMAINCAFCHTARLRESEDAEPRIYAATAANTVDVQGYQRFLGDCAADTRFAPQTLLPIMEEAAELSWFEGLLHRFLLIRLTREGLLEQREVFAWTESRPRWGPGRIDPFNPVKFDMLELADDGTIGNSDMQPVWQLDAREAIRADAPWHWDGLNTSIGEVVLSSALGDGTVAEEYDPEALGRVERYLRAVEAPPSPHRPDPGAVERGAGIFAAECGSCHGREQPDRILTVIPVEEVGTDMHRVAMWTDEARDAYLGYREGYDWGFEAFQNVEGYVAQPHFGLWMTAPYLHNGSVPTLADLLEPTERRPVAFVRGLEVLDGERGGFLAPACDPRAPPRQGFCFDTSLPGNGNQGHLYGTALPAGEKADLLAYLLTL
jgi:hypothetical protein